MSPQTITCPRCGNPGADHYLATGADGRDAHHVWCAQCLYHEVKLAPASGPQPRLQMVAPPKSLASA